MRVTTAQRVLRFSLDGILQSYAVVACTSFDGPNALFCWTRARGSPTLAVLQSTTMGYLKRKGLFAMRYQMPRIPGIDEHYHLLADAFVLSLEAANRSQNAIKTYLTGVQQFGAFLVAQNMPQDLRDIHRTHLEEFSTFLQRAGKEPATVEARLKGLHRFFAWAASTAEGEIDQNPMDKMGKFQVPEKPVPIPTVAEVQQLVKTCEQGHGFLDRRDAAIVRLFASTGMRLSELTGLKMGGVRLQERTITVLGKGDRERTLALTDKTALALNRYLRMRPAFNDGLDPVWLSGHRTPLEDGGVQLMFIRRCREAGIGRLHPHQLRHWYADQWLSRGEPELDLMKTLGHRDWAMVKRYTRARDAVRARETAKRLGIGDDL